MSLELDLFRTVGVLESSYLDMFKALFLTIIIELFCAIIFNKYFNKPYWRYWFYFIWIWIILLLTVIFLINSIFIFSNIDNIALYIIISIVIQLLLVVWVIFLVYLYKKKNYLLLTVVLINIITNPLLNFIIAFLWNHSLVIVIPLELIVIYVEYILLNYALWSENDKSDLYVPFYKQRNFKLSLIMNLCSWMIWYLIYL